MTRLDESDEISGSLRNMQIIWAALVSGIVLFLVITLIYRSYNNEVLVEKPILDYSALFVLFGLLAALLGILAYFTIPNLIVNSQRQALAAGRINQILKNDAIPRTESRALASIAMSQKILGLAMLEGPAFLNGVFFMISGSLVSLGTALVMLVLMASRVPTRADLESWLDTQRRLLHDEKARHQPGSA